MSTWLLSLLLGSHVSMERECLVKYFVPKKLMWTMFCRDALSTLAGTIVADKISRASVRKLSVMTYFMGISRDYPEVFFN